MSQSGKIRTRSERVAALDLPPGPWERAWLNLRRRDIVGRVSLAFLSALVICIIIQGWNPPFDFRAGDAPRHSIVARVPFTRANDYETKQAQDRAANQARYVYVQDPAPLVQLRLLLRNTISEMTGKATLKDWDPTPNLDKWKEFQPLDATDAVKTDKPEENSQEQNAEKLREEEFQKFKVKFTGPEKIKELDRALEKAFEPYEEHGLLEKLSSREKTEKPQDNLKQDPQKKNPPPEIQKQGNQEEILVHPVGETNSEKVQVADVLIGDGIALKESLRNELHDQETADRLFSWLRPRLMPTLKLDRKETDKSIAEARKNTPEAMFSYAAGDLLAKAGEPLDDEHLALLRMEYGKMIENRGITAPMSLLIRGGAMMYMVFVAFLLCGIYTRYRQRNQVTKLSRVFVITLLSLTTIALAQWAAADKWHAEILPLTLFGMTLAIITRRELALLTTGILCAILVLALGEDLSELVVLLGTTTTAILCLGGIRSRSKLIYVGLLSGVVAIMLNLTMETIGDQPFGWILLRNSLLTGLWTVAAGFVMTGLLPFIEHAFGVLTDLSLLELGDVAHPLLQELVRRAPSTYNHSVTVGSIAEAAAESIGGRGLLCRVGAYFHDIGKMLKPGYFIENQSTEGNRHDSLVPAMSTLVIIAHIKDGSDLGRQHHLPQPIIDLIAQHHGTTLVEYFYGRAQRESDPNNGEVDESSFRYPGPKPQTKEAAVLMLADAVESASRTLVDPTPARIESIVREIAERRLDDGQFDESGLTLRELRTIERSLAMSVASIYHGRIKYPDQKTA
jgi:putative nucleotidyltransferase with HDIG domain